MDTWVWFQSGINTDGAHNPKTNRKLTKGDILSLNTFPMISGYYTALERTLLWKDSLISIEWPRSEDELIKPNLSLKDNNGLTLDHLLKKGELF